MNDTGHFPAAGYGRVLRLFYTKGWKKFVATDAQENFLKHIDTLNLMDLKTEVLCLPNLAKSSFSSAFKVLMNLPTADTKKLRDLFDDDKSKDTRSNSPQSFALQVGNWISNMLRYHDQHTVFQDLAQEAHKANLLAMLNDYTDEELCYRHFLLGLLR